MTRTKPVHRHSGVTLVELLVATCVAATALTGAWSWVWNAGTVARATGARAQALTADAYAVRVLRDDLAQAAGLLATPPGRTPSEAFAILHRHPGEPPETVTVVWDRSRRVVWRKASGTYLADQVSSFVVRYFTAEGAELSAVELLAPDGPQRTARVEVTVRTLRDGRSATHVLNACVGPA